MFPYARIDLSGPGHGLARGLLALALLVLVAAAVPGLILWPAWPDRVERLITCYVGWTRALLALSTTPDAAATGQTAPPAGTPPGIGTGPDMRPAA